MKQKKRKPDMKIFRTSIETLLSEALEVTQTQRVLRTPRWQRTITMRTVMIKANEIYSIAWII